MLVQNGWYHGACWQLRPNRRTSCQLFYCSKISFFLSPPQAARKARIIMSNIVQQDILQQLQQLQQDAQTALTQAKSAEAGLYASIGGSRLHSPPCRRTRVRAPPLGPERSSRQSWHAWTRFPPAPPRSAKTSRTPIRHAASTAPVQFKLLTQSFSRTRAGEHSPRQGRRCLMLTPPKAS